MWHARKKKDFDGRNWIIEYILDVPLRLGFWVFKQTPFFLLSYNPDELKLFLLENIFLVI